MTASHPDATMRAYNTLSFILRDGANQIVAHAEETKRAGGEIGPPVPICGARVSLRAAPRAAPARSPHPARGDRKHSRFSGFAAIPDTR